MKITREHVVGLICIAISIVVLCITPSFPAGQEGVNLTGPAFFPNVLAIAYIILGLLQLISAFRAQAKAGKGQESATKEPQQKRRIATTLEFIVLMIAYIIFFVPLGYLVSTILFLFLLMWLLGLKWWKGLLYSAIYTAVIYLIFGMLFTIGLPAGILGTLGI